MKYTVALAAAAALVDRTLAGPIAGPHEEIVARQNVRRIILTPFFIDLSLTLS
jgi:hypothetical protein